jgi:WD40 repeat protein
MMKKQWLTLSLVFLLLACSKVQSTPVPIEVVRVTDTAVPPTPTATPLPTAAHTTIPTHTPSPTATPVPTETPTPAPTVPIWVAAGTAVPQPSAVIAPDNAAQVTELARWGRGVINDVAYSGDGRWIAVGTSTGVYIHDASDLNQAPLYLDTTFNAKLVDISSDGSRVAVALAGGTVQLWDVAQVEILYTKPQGASHLEFAPNGEVLAVVEGGNVAIWQVDSGEVLQAFSDVLGVDFSDDSELLATWDYGSLSVYRWREGLLLEEAEPVDYFVSPHGEEFSSLISDVQFTPQSETLITTMPVNPAYSTTGDVGIQIGNDLLLTIPHIQKLASWPPITTGCDMTVFNADPPSSPDVWQIELSSDGQTFALVYDDHGYADDAKKYSSVQFYRLDSGSQQYMVDENILDMAIAPDGVTWVAGSQDGRLQIRRVSDGVVLDAFDGYESPVLDLAVSPDNKMVAITYLDEVKLYNAENVIF